jgi:hypothetical protein
VLQGAALPALGLALLDSAFFASYGQALSVFGQSRDRLPSMQSAFLSGSFAGGVCAILEVRLACIASLFVDPLARLQSKFAFLRVPATSSEYQQVIKTRAQASVGAELGSMAVARSLVKREGVRGLYRGFVPTAVYE